MPSESYWFKGIDGLCQRCRMDAALPEFDVCKSCLEEEYAILMEAEEKAKKEKAA